jgi:hypothetical protein
MTASTLAQAKAAVMAQKYQRPERMCLGVPLREIAARAPLRTTAVVYT